MDGLIGEGRYVSVSIRNAFRERNTTEDTRMARGSKGGGSRGGGSKGGGSKGGKGPAGWPSTTGKPSGGGRDNAPPKK